MLLLFIISKCSLFDCFDLYHKCSNIQEAGVIARTARKYLIDAALGNGSPFDIHRTTQSFEVFMGTGTGIRTPEYRWQSLVYGIHTKDGKIDGRYHFPLTYDGL